MYARLFTGLGLLSVLGCGGDSGTPASPTGGGANTVTVGNNFFSPITLSVPAGTTVTWSWAQGAESHNVTFDDGSASSPTQSSGSYQRTFSAAGSFPYHCTIHGAAVMHGTITVGGGGTGGTGGSGMGGGGTGGGGYGP